jgi:flagellar basal-body rod protein FlgC
MGNGMSISAAGMQAASQWFSATASNIVKLNSDGALPAAAPADGGGNTTPPQSAPPASPLAYGPQAPYANMQGMITPPNSDLATEMVPLREAQNSFRANLSAFKAASHMFKTLLDATA